jgi:hypothetical protein
LNHPHRLFTHLSLDPISPGQHRTNPSKTSCCSTCLFQRKGESIDSHRKRIVRSIVSEGGWNDQVTASILPRISPCL